MRDKFQLTRYGEKGALLSGLTRAQQDHIRSCLEEAPPPRLREYILGYDTLLLVFASASALAALDAWLGRMPPALVENDVHLSEHEIPVRYEGPDLLELAHRVQLSEREIIELHTAPTYTVRFMGFSPGFPYLDGLDEKLHVPRKEKPRTRITRGSVAIGGSHAGIYSVESPGGWHILGITDVMLFNPARAVGLNASAREIFRFQPGDKVRFRAVYP